MSALGQALGRLLERLEAHDPVGAATVLAEVQAGLGDVALGEDLLELRLLNARCQEAARRLKAGVEQQLQGAAASQRAVAAYDDLPR